MSRFSKSTSQKKLALSFRDCPAKSTESNAPGLSVEHHCRIVGSVARALLNQIPRPLRHLFSDGSVTLAASHDLGKVSPGFVKKAFPQLLPATPTSAVFCENHAEVSEAAIRTWAHSHGRDNTWQSWAKVAGVHHGKRIRSAQSEPCFRYGGESWSTERSKLLEVLIEAFGPLPEESPTPESLWLAAGLTTVADWIGSNEDWFPTEGLPPTANHAECARLALEGAGFAIPEIKRDCSFRELFPAIASPNEMQAMFHEVAAGPGLFILEAPMGMGKTEAALYATYRLMADGHHHGLYFALPTRLTSNRLHNRLEAFLSQAFGVEAAARLVHGQAWLADRYPGGEELRPGGAWFAPIKRALLYPFGIGTIDQALLTVMNVKHGFVRAYGLAGKVVILDEVHSYDEYTGTLMTQLVDCLIRLGCTVMILSATLTQERRNSFLGAGGPVPAGAYPLITYHSSDEVTTHTVTPPTSRRVVCRYSPDSFSTLAEQAAAMADNEHCVLWICNTVARSQRAFSLVKSAVREGIEVGLLHSRFPPWRREMLETCWLSWLGKDGARPSGCVLVATQVVEQSVDIDADTLITDLAPTDMLLQRMGRLWRHPREGRTGPANCLIVGNCLSSAGGLVELKELIGSSGYVYAPYVLWRSYTIWKNRPDIVLPDDIRTLIEATYCCPNTADPPWVQKDLYDKLVANKQRLGQLAMAMTREDLPTRLDDEDAALTRYSDRPMVNVLLVRDCDPLDSSRARLELASGKVVELGTTGARRNVAAARQIHSNLVTLPKYPDFEKVNERSTPRWLRTVVYGPVVVLKINNQGFLEHQHGESTRYGYDEERGVWRRETSAIKPVEGSVWEDDFDESDW